VSVINLNDRARLFLFCARHVVSQIFEQINSRKESARTYFETMATTDKVIALTGMAAGSISVMAPSDMPDGYEFFADAGNGNSYKVRVVRKKQRFVLYNARLVPAGCLPDACLSVAVVWIIIIASVDEILAGDVLPRGRSPSSSMKRLGVEENINHQPIGREAVD
jgi:hypothetical protein